MSMTLKIDIRGVTALQKRINKLNTASIEVGFFPEDVYGPENDNLPVAQVVKFQEQGSHTYPRRPFFTETMDSRDVIRCIAHELANVFRETLMGKGKPVAVMQRVGDYLKYEIEDAIVNYPGRNSTWWADYKGFNDPLRYTDKMLNSVKVKIKK